MEEEEGSGSGNGGGSDSRERILEAALRLFSRHGYAETSVARVAHDAGVSKGLVFHYFDTKSELLDAVFDRGAERLERALGAVRGEGATAPPAAVVMEVLGLVADDLPWWRLLLRLRAQPGPAAETARAWGGALEEVLEQGLRRQGSAHPRREARALAAAVEGAAQRYVLEPEEYPLVEVAETLVDSLAAPP